MNISKKIICLILLLPALLYSQDIFRGDIVISDISAECIDTTFQINPLAESIPTNIEYQKDKLVYEVIITLRLYGNDFIYTKPLALTFSTPDNNSITIIVNQELYDLVVNESYEFIVILQSREKGWTNVRMNEWDMYNLEIVSNFNVNFIDNSFYLD